MKTFRQPDDFLCSTLIVQTRLLVRNTAPRSKVRALKTIDNITLSCLPQNSSRLLGDIEGVHNVN